MIKRFFPYSYILVIISLFFYSFTQIDLGLTFSQSSFLFNIQQGFQQIGYFNRPLSTQIYLIILAFLFSYYIYFLYLAFKNKITKKTIWILIGVTSFVLAFSYNAFSHDLFNYIFDAKIITYYHENPYTHKALDFPNDPMLSFMHWTHRYYPYGQFWLVLTAPLSFVGFNIFILTFFIFKIFIALTYLAACYFISRTLKIVNPKYELVGLVFFALSPLVLIESLVSAHNDVPMIAFALAGIYLFFSRRKVLAIILIVLSALIKIPAIVLIFPIILSYIPEKYMRIKMNNERYIWLFVIFSLLGLFYALTKLEIQPWYFLWALPFVSLLKPNKYVLALAIGVSLGLLLRYAVFLYFGEWQGDAVYIRNSLTVIASLFPITLICAKDLLDQLPFLGKIGRK